MKRICERLTDDPRIDASEIEVDVQQQKVTLRGSVGDRRTKYAVEELVESYRRARHRESAARAPVGALLLLVRVERVRHLVVLLQRRQRRGRELLQLGRHLRRL